MEFNHIGFIFNIDIAFIVFLHLILILVALKKAGWFYG